MSQTGLPAPSNANEAIPVRLSTQAHSNRPVAVNYEMRRRRSNTQKRNRRPLTANEPRNEMQSSRHVTNAKYKNNDNIHSKLYRNHYNSKNRQKSSERHRFGFTGIRRNSKNFRTSTPPGTHNAQAAAQESSDSYDGAGGVWANTANPNNEWREGQMGKSSQRRRRRRRATGSKNKSYNNNNNNNNNNYNESKSTELRTANEMRHDDKELAAKPKRKQWRNIRHRKIYTNTRITTQLERPQHYERAEQQQQQQQQQQHEQFSTGNELKNPRTAPQARSKQMKPSEDEMQRSGGVGMWSMGMTPLLMNNLTVSSLSPPSSTAERCRACDGFGRVELKPNALKPEPKSANDGGDSGDSGAGVDGDCYSDIWNYEPFVNGMDKLANDTHGNSLFVNVSADNASQSSTHTPTANELPGSSKAEFNCDSLSFFASSNIYNTPAAPILPMPPISWLTPNTAGTYDHGAAAGIAAGPALGFDNVLLSPAPPPAVDQPMAYNTLGCMQPNSANSCACARKEMLRDCRTQHSDPLGLAQAFSLCDKPSVQLPHHNWPPATATLAAAPQPPFVGQPQCVQPMPFRPSDAAPMWNYAVVQPAGAMPGPLEYLMLANSQRAHVPAAPAPVPSLVPAAMPYNGCGYGYGFGYVPLQQSDLSAVTMMPTGMPANAAPAMPQHCLNSSSGGAIWDSVHPMLIDHAKTQFLKDILKVPHTTPQ